MAEWLIKCAVLRHSIGHGFEPQTRPLAQTDWHHQCSSIHLTASMWVKVAQLPCHIHAYTVYTSIGDRRMKARKKPMRKDTRSPKQKQSVASQNGPWSNNFFLKKYRLTQI